jgi:microcin C transport system substrate-binding protein
MRPLARLSLFLALLATLPAQAAEDPGPQAVAPMRALIFNLRRPIFADRRVREALNLAFDFEWMNRALFHGAYRRIESYFPQSDLAASGDPSPGEFALLRPFLGQVPPEVFGPAWVAPITNGSGDVGLRSNLRQAMGLLTAAGWVVRDGRLVDGKTGQPFAFEILLGDPHDRRMALPYVRALARLGIAATVSSPDAAVYLQRRGAFDFDMIADRWDQPAGAPEIPWTSTAADTKGSANYPGIKSPAVDALAAVIAAARDPVQRLDGVHALDRVLTWGYYTVPLYDPAVDRAADDGRQ